MFCADSSKVIDELLQFFMVHFLRFFIYILQQRRLIFSQVF
jgi:hypothetical protein